LSSRRFLFESHVASQDSVQGDVALPAAEIGRSLAQAVFELVKPLYLAFDFFELPFAVVEEELAKMRSGAQ
jgi:hypothetical protein